MERKKPRIVIIGSGSVATHFGRALKNNAYPVKQVFSRTLANAKILAEQLGSTYTSDIKSIDNEADLYLVAVSDNALSELLSSVNFNNAIVVHTSGFTEMQVLEKTSRQYGVIYPLQSLSAKIKIDFFNEVPLCIEASDKTTLKIISDIATVLSSKVNEIDSEHRKTLHIAAVFMNNFSNHLFNISENLCKQNDLDFNMLKALAQETVKKAFNNLPQNVQTGPAARNDIKVIQEHLKWLEQNASQYKQIYQMITDSILKK